jgi:hypothetical protein
MTALYLKRMCILHAHYFVQFQEELDAEEPGSAEPEVRIPDAQADAVTFAVLGRKILSTAAEGVAKYEQEKIRRAAQASTPDRECPRLSPREERMARVEERRARMIAYRARFDAQWRAEIQTDDVLEDELVYRFGPGAELAGLAYLRQVQMQRCSSEGSAFTDVVAVENYKLR